MPKRKPKPKRIEYLWRSHEEGQVGCGCGLQLFRWQLECRPETKVVQFDDGWPCRKHTVYVPDALLRPLAEALLKLAEEREAEE